MPSPSREALRSGSFRRIHPGRNLTKADIFLWEADGERLAVKDYDSRPFWIKATLGRLLVRRECRAYERLKGIVGIARFEGRIDSYALATQFVEGRSLAEYRPGEVSAEFFFRLLSLVVRVHSKGVAQGDLHHRDVLVGPGRSPYLVDFSTAVFLGPAAGRFRRVLFRAACQSDRRAVLKLKRRHAPGALTEEESRELDCVPHWYRIGKVLGGLRPGRRRHVSRTVRFRDR